MYSEQRYQSEVLKSDKRSPSPVKFFAQPLLLEQLFLSFHWPALFALTLHCHKDKASKHNKGTFAYTELSKNCSSNQSSQYNFIVVPLVEQFV